MPCLTLLSSLSLPINNVTFHGIYVSEKYIMSFISMSRLIFAVCILCAAMEQLHSIQRGKNLRARALSSQMLFGHWSSIKKGDHTNLETHPPTQVWRKSRQTKSQAKSTVSKVLLNNWLQFHIQVQNSYSRGKSMINGYCKDEINKYWGELTTRKEQPVFPSFPWLPCEPSYAARFSWQSRVGCP